MQKEKAAPVSSPERGTVIVAPANEWAVIMDKSSFHTSHIDESDRCLRHCSTLAAPICVSRVRLSSICQLSVLIKANVCKLLEPKLKRDGFNVLNKGRCVYFPASGQQLIFDRQFGEIAPPS